MHTAWRSQDWASIATQLKFPAIFALIAGLAIPALVYGRFGGLVTVGAIAAFWIMTVSLIQPLRSWRRPPGTPAITRAALGMSIAHFGVGIFVLGVSIVQAFSVEQDMRMVPGQSVEVSGFTFELRELRNVQGPNYQALEGIIEIRRNGEFVGELRPQKRTYLVQQSPMTEAGIHADLRRDLFVALGDPLGDGAWSVRLQYKPLIRLIWLGALIMALGGLVAASDRRYQFAQGAVPATAKPELGRQSA
jgi:cytochrome c-type biogenesis protein CcmF